MSLPDPGTYKAIQAVELRRRWLESAVEECKHRVRKLQEEQAGYENELVTVYAMGEAADKAHWVKPNTEGAK